MPGKPRKTLATRAVLDAFMEDPAAERYGLEVSRAANVASGTLYPILARLEASGMLTSRIEELEKYAATGRPPRRYYRLTGDGVEFAREALTGGQKPAKQLRDRWALGSHPIATRGLA